MKEKISDLIKNYLKETIATKKGMKKRIYQLEKDVKDAKENEKYAIDQMNKYKQKYNIERKEKLKLAIEYKQLTKDFKQAVKENEKLKKEK